jgi:outer membrane protein assembly factor BamB
MKLRLPEIMKSTRLTTLVIAFYGGLLQPRDTAGATPPNWPQFRGPNCQGVADADKPPVAFGPGQALLWKTPMPSGVSSPCIWGDRIFLTAFDQDRKRLETLCVERKTGAIVWRKDAPNESIQEVHQISSPANTTPTTDGKIVCVYFVPFGLVAYDFDGKVKWTKPLDTPNLFWGGGASPAMIEGMVVLKVSRGDDSHLLALRPESGEEVWKAADPIFSDGWATPITWTENGSGRIGVFNRGGFVVHDARTGTNVWRLSGMPPQAVATPSVGNGVIYISAAGILGGMQTVTQPLPFKELLSKYDKNKDGLLGTDELTDDFLLIDRGGSRGAGNMPWKMFIGPGQDGKPRTFGQAEWESEVNQMFARIKEGEKELKSAVFAVPTGGSGDVTNRLAWIDSRSVPEVPSPLLYRDRLYHVRNGGLFTCRDPQSGKSLYDERVGAEGGYYASPIAADGRIYVSSDRGIVTVLKAGDTFNVLSRTDLKETIMATPAIVEDKLYVRTAQHLWAFGENRIPQATASKSDARQ